MVSDASVTDKDRDGLTGDHKSGTNSSRHIGISHPSMALLWITTKAYKVWTQSTYRFTLCLYTGWCYRDWYMILPHHLVEVIEANYNLLLRTRCQGYQAICLLLCDVVKECKVQDITPCGFIDSSLSLN